MIETPRLLLRAWRDCDREPFRRINSDPRVMEFYPSILTREESDATAARIAAHFRERGFGLYAAESRETGEFIGYIGLSTAAFEAHFTPCVEVGWRLARAYWNRGLATEGARAVVRHGFDELGLDEIVSFTTAANLRSRRVMAKLGMTYKPADDFAHPGLPAGHPLAPHVLYRLRA